MEKIVLGTGILNWPPSERRSGAYERVVLEEPGNSNPTWTEIRLPRFDDLCEGNILAQVVGPRIGTLHVGDFVSGVAPNAEELPIGHSRIIGNGIPTAGNVIDQRTNVLLGLCVPDTIPSTTRRKSFDVDALFELHGYPVEITFVANEKGK